MKSTASYYQEVISYILINKHKTFSTLEVANAMHNPSRFLKLRKAVDKMGNDETYIKHEVNMIQNKWNSKHSYVNENDHELLKDCRFLLSHGLKISAIKVYRSATGFGLKESKEAVERL
jgi:ribosomal protein L7/L12